MGLSGQPTKMFPNSGRTAVTDPKRSVRCSDSWPMSYQIAGRGGSENPERKDPVCGSSDRTLTVTLRPLLEFPDLKNAPSDVIGWNMASENLIEAALAESFNPPPLKRQSLTHSLDSSGAPRNVEEVANETQSSSDSADSVEIEAWKSQYEEHVKEWREQNIEARKKAEEERARWEAVRQQEAGQGKRHSSYGEPGWQTVSGQPSLAASSEAPKLGSPSPADVRDLVSGEPQRNPPPTSTAATNHERQDTWEDLPSELTSSYPSMSFPSEEHSTPPEHHNRSTHQEIRSSPTVTGAIFDSSLTTETRIKALGASLAINLLLPFVNGVMLGFGEIFAKNVVLRWLGWSTPNTSGSVASSLGLGSRRTQR
ncbi:hypothetical protein L218DRAFT_985710 [Marasmius fiardii PR-910]|nr:hypothetical protein L218DRAFT_985710 [Marasmius fiardii PR-910]